jgi:hypothetical protein
VHAAYPYRRFTVHGVKGKGDQLQNLGGRTPALGSIRRLGGGVAR